MKIKKWIGLEMKYPSCLPTLCFLTLFLLSLIIYPVIAPSTLFAETPVSGHIGEDITWKKEGSPYIVTGDVSIYGDSNNGITLTIEAGVEVRFDRGTSLSVGAHGNRGAIVAEGIENEPIKFTANTDSPIQGYWQGIRFYGGTINDATIMKHCVVEYAGYSDRRGIYLYSASPVIRNCMIREIRGNGIYCINSSPRIKGNRIRNNSDYGINCVDTGSVPTITENLIANNGSYPLGIGANSFGSVNNNIFEGNGIQSVVLRGDRIDRNTTYQDIGIPYIVAGDISVYGDTENGVTLTLNPGVDLRFNNERELIIGSGDGDKGALIAAGSEDKPITFTANAYSLRPGHWRRIRFNTGTTDNTRMEHCIVEYAGYNEQRGIDISDTSLTIKNCQIRENQGHGIFCNSSISTITRNTIHNNSQYGIHCTGPYLPSITENDIYNNTAGGIYNESTASGVIAYNIIYQNGHGIYHNGSGDLILSYNNLYDNYSSSSSYEVYNNSDKDINARNNWWGDATHAEIDEGGNPKDLTRIFDGFDDGSKGFVDYANPFKQRLITITEISPETELINSCVYMIEPLDMDRLTLRNTQLYLGNKATIANLTLTDNSAIYPIAQGPIHLEILEDLVIHSGSVIDVSGKGYSGGNQGPGETLDNAAGSTLYAGGSHGGPGGADSGSVANRCYGNVYFPDHPGSGGGALTSGGNIGGRGGGVVRLIVGKILTLNGIISANGEDGLSHGGGGSGGSIWIETNNIQGSGNIEAKGGSALEAGCGGGGGRIAVYHNTQLNPTPGGPPPLPFPPILISANGGQGSDIAYPSGGAGAIYIKNKSLPYGDLIIDNKEITDGARPTELPLTGIGPANNTHISGNILSNSCEGFSLPNTVSGIRSFSGLWINPNVLQDQTVRIIDHSPDSLITDPNDGDMTQAAHTGSHYIGAYVFNNLKIKRSDLSCQDYLDIKGRIITNDGNLLIADAYYLDVTPPAPPYVYPIPSPSLEQTITIRGIKDPNHKVYLNCQSIIEATSAIYWQINYNLQEGKNTLSFTQKNSGGNHSIPVIKTVVYDEIPPLEVLPSADGKGDGTTITLAWQDYKEVSDHGYYTIYQSDAPFTDIAEPGVTLIGTTDRGIKIFTATGLTEGSIYYYAVIGVDNKGNANQTVTQAVNAVPEDGLAPEDVTNLRVTACTAESISVSWTPSANTTGDLDRQTIHMYGDVKGEGLGPGATTYSDIPPASQELNYISSVMVRVYDDANNASPGAVITNIPLLVPGPDPIYTQSKINGIRLSWASAGSYAGSYNIYIRQTPFGDTLEGLTPIANTKKLTYTLTGLNNETTYYLTVSTINTMGFEDKTRFTTVTEIPHSDQQGPQVSAFRANNKNIIQGMVLRYPTVFSVSATDETGIHRVEFYTDGESLSMDTTSPNQSATWDIVRENDGDHTIKAVIYDTLGNQTEVQHTIAVQCAAPHAPKITAPESGVVSEASQTIEGSAQPGAQINLLLNNVLQTLVPSVKADTSGNFSFLFTLQEGTNTIRLSAKNRKGTSPLSASLELVYDTQSPEPPINLSGIAKADRWVRLSWDPPPGNRIKGYDVYRSISGGALTKVNKALVETTTYTDLPGIGTDGVPCQYQIKAIDHANLDSNFSDAIIVVPDGTEPQIVNIAYNHRGFFDDANVPAIMGRGELEMTITLSEELSGIPFLSVVAAGGKLIGISLTKINKTEYFGSFEITGDTPSGEASINFSGRDRAGNRGYDVNDLYETFIIDTQGPWIITLDLDPAPPINNDPQTDVYFEFTLDDTPMEDPQVFFRINEDDPIKITLLEMAGPDRRHWTGSFTIPETAGNVPNKGDLLTLSFSAVDYLRNPGAGILAQHQFEVYQGELPTLSQPQGLKATAKPDCKVELTWLAIPEAAGYHVYRKEKNDPDTQYILLTDPDRIQTTTYTDTAPADGPYTYAVTTIRQEGALTSESSRATVTITADGTPPPIPQDLSLILEGYGLVATWTPLVEAQTYTLLRHSFEITPADIHQAAIVQENVTEATAIDPAPSPDYPYYAVVALDKAGNRSDPSSSEYFNIDLLPLNNLTITQDEGAIPILSWERTNPDLKYNIYIEVDGKEVLLAKLYNGITYPDTGYDYKERLYKITVVDDKGTQDTSDDIESIAREAFLPLIPLTIPEEETIYRGIINRLDLELANDSNRPIRISEISMEFTHNKDPNNYSYHYKTTFISLQADEVQTIPMVVGGEPDWPDNITWQMRLLMEPEYGTTIEVYYNRKIPVKDRTYIFTLSHDELLRGVNTKVTLTLENTREQAIELVTAKSTKEPSDEVRIRLIDIFGNPLSEARLDERMGPNVMATTSGRVIARIQPGETYISPEIDLFVPLNTPDYVILRAEVDNLYHHLGRDTQVKIAQNDKNPILVKDNVTRLVETAYYAQITESGKMISEAYQKTDQFAAEDTVILKGFAWSRETDLPMPYVPVIIGIKYKGYIKQFNTFTDLDGGFRLEYPLRSGQGGSYSCWAYHPDMIYEYDQHTFHVRMLTLNPYDITANTRTNYQLNMDLNLENRSILTIRNLKLVNPLEEIDGGGTYTIDSGANEGLTVIIPENIPELGPYEKRKYTIAISAENPLSGTLELALVSDEKQTGWQDITIDYTITQSYPALRVTPSYLMTGLTKGDQGLEYITIKNMGLAALEGLQDPTIHEFTLAPAGGTPAFDWIRIASDADFDRLAPGEEMNVCLLFNPPEMIDDGIYEYLLFIDGEPSFHYTYHVYFTVSSSDTGTCEFYIKDIYTGSQHIDKNGNLEYDPDGNPVIIYGVDNATITLHNDIIPSLVFDANTGTDHSGIAYFEDIPVGKYYYRVQAPEHESASGVIRIKPNVLVTEELALAYQAVTVEWSVVPVTIQDKYEIKLTTTFKTHVPAPVVVIEPAGVNLPEMKKGDIFNAEYTITNHGLVAAENIIKDLPDSDEYFTYEFFGPEFERIAAKQTIVMPYRIVCHTSPFADNEGAGQGGIRQPGNDEYGYSADESVECGFNGKAIYIRRISGRGGSGGPPPPPTQSSGSFSGGGPVDEVIVEGGGPGYTVYVPEPQSDCPVDNGSSNGNHCYNDITESEVDPKQGTYIFKVTDITMPTRGGEIKLERKYLSSVSDAIGPEPENWPFGKNWLSPFIERLRFAISPDRLKFDPSPVQKYVSISQGRGYSSLSGSGAPPGTRTKFELIKPADSQESNEIILSDGSGEVRRYVISSNNIANKPNDYDDSVIIKLFEGALLPGLISTQKPCFIWRHISGDWKKYDGNTGNLLYIGDRKGDYVKLDYDSLDRLVKVSDGRDSGKYIEFIYQGNSMLMSKAIDSIGREVVYAHEDGKENLTRVIDVRGNVTAYTYDDLHRMRSKTTLIGSEDYPNGKTVYMDYTGSGDGRSRAVYFKDTENEFGDGYNSEIFGKYYDYAGKPDKSVVGTITSSEGRTYEKTYDFLGNILKIKGPYGVLETYEYENHSKGVPRKIIHTDDAGNTEIEEVDIRRRFSSKTDKAGNTIKYTYTEPTDSDVTVAGNVTPNWSDLKEIVDELGRITRFTYDQKGNVIRLIQAAGTPEEFTVRLNYDEYGNVTGIFLPGDADNDPTYQYEYNDEGYISRSVEKMSSDQNIEIKYAYSYDENHKLNIAITDGKGKLWHLRLNEKGSLESIRRPGDSHDYIRMEYDGVDNLIKSIILPDDPSNTRTTRYRYWQNNLIKSIQEVVEDNTPPFEFLYDKDGLLTSVKDEEGKATSYEYDFAGRNTLEQDGEGNETIYEYIARSSFCTACNMAGAYGRNPAKITTPAGGIPGATHTWDIEYDRLDQPISFTNQLGAQIMLSYDKVGNVIQLIDENDKVYDYTYDALDRLTTTSVNSKILYQYTYDNRGNLKEIFAGSGSDKKIAVFYEYYRNGLVHYEYRPLGQTIEYRYDNNMNVSSVVDARNQLIRYLYNDRDQLSTINYYSAGDHGYPVKTVAFEYDDYGNVISADDGLTRIEYIHDSRDRLLSETVIYEKGTAQEFNKTISYTYYENGMVKSYTSAEDKTYQYLYDKNDILTSIILPDGKGTIDYSDFCWQSPRTVTFPNGVTTSNTYDQLMRLDDIQVSAASQIMNHDYGYDLADNLISKDTQDNDYTYQYDDLYQVTYVDSTDDSLDEAFTYDLYGNRVSKSGISGQWSYDAANKLLGYGNVTYTYNENGNPVTRSENGSITHRYIYDISDRLVAIEDGSDMVTVSYEYDMFGRRIKKTVDGNTIYYLYSQDGLVGEYGPGGVKLRTYGYQPTSDWMTDPVFMEEGGSYYFYHNDLIGTPQKMTDEVGNQVWSILYSVFGETVSLDSTITNNLRFAGQYYDEETGFHYNWHRYYLPEIGRYLTQDPIGFGGGILNLYAYVNSNPVNWIDPTGRVIPLIAIGGAILAGAVISGTINAILSEGNAWSAFWTGFGVGAIATTAGIITGLIAPALGLGIIGTGLAVGFVGGAISAALTGGDPLLGGLVGMPFGLMGQAFSGSIPYISAIAASAWGTFAQGFADFFNVAFAHEGTGASEKCDVSGMKGLSGLYKLWKLIGEPLWNPFLFGSKAAPFLSPGGTRRNFPPYVGGPVWDPFL